jgi:hypothetical protein
VDKNVYKVDRGLGKPFITAVFTFYASGMMCPPILMYPYQRILSQITQSAPDDWQAAHSPTGWMTADVF